MQVDVGFGDRLVPTPEPIDFPTILSFPAHHLRGYRRETVIAEKVHAMVFLGELNTRMKDFYDVWLLAMTFAFDGATLVDAIRATFTTRDTNIDTAPLAFSDKFVDTPRTRANWAAFVRRLQLPDLANDMRVIVKDLRDFLTPVLAACAGGTLRGDVATARSLAMEIGEIDRRRLMPPTGGIDEPPFRYSRSVSCRSRYSRSCHLG